MSVYLDASVLLPTIVDEPTSDQVDAFIDGTPDIIVSDFAAMEVASAVSRLVRMRKLERANATKRLDDFDAWRAVKSPVVEVQASDVRLATIYVRRFELKLRAPDALHVAMAQRLGVTLATLDRRLATAAQSLDLTVNQFGRG